MFGFCNNELEQRQDGQNDFERKGYYDRERYNDPWSDCSKYYTEGYDDARRDEERREEYREEERQQEERDQQRYQEQQERQLQEEEYYFESMAIEQQIQQSEDRDQIDKYSNPENDIDDLPF